MHLFDYLKPIRGSFEPSTPADIDRLSSVVGLPIPAEYVAFLQRFGRCMIDGEATILGHAIFTFHGTRSDAGNVIDDYLLHDDYVEQKLIPVANDLFNNRYVLSAATGEIGFIEYGPRVATFFPIAKSFGEFI